MISQDLFDEKILLAIDRVTGNSERESSDELYKCHWDWSLWHLDS